MTITLSGQGVNPYWNVPRTLGSLQGLQKSGMLLIKELDKHIAQRDAGGGGHPEAIGNIVATVLLTSYATEIALKTVHAQTVPDKKPPCGHDLAKLFARLDDNSQRRAQHKLETLSVLGEPNWIGKNPNIEKIIGTGSSNFTDWRYLSEKPSVGGGVPKGLINVAQALRIACLDLVLSKQWRPASIPQTP